jgi:hypothetical protein
MTDNEREAFEKYAVTNGFKITRLCGDGDYSDIATSFLYRGWQAAKADSEPKLTEEEAVERVAIALYNEDCCYKDNGIYQGTHRNYSQLLSKSKIRWESKAKAALKAAGMEFRSKEE